MRLPLGSALDDEQGLAQVRRASKNSGRSLPPTPTVVGKPSAWYRFRNSVIGKGSWLYWSPVCLEPAAAGGARAGSART